MQLVTRGIPLAFFYIYAGVPLRSLLTILFFCTWITSWSQHDPATLAKQLTAAGVTDKEKVTRIFRWITDNISYTVFRKPVSPFVPVAWEQDEDGPLKPLNERVAIDVLKRRTALCDGYARLFKTLCDFAEIPSAIIQGYAKGEGRNLRFGVNHYWNAVFFDDEWHLLDATWASGYLNWRGDEFIRDYENAYFLTAPKDFIKDHYPDDPRWTLLNETVMPDEFRFSPFKQKAFGKYSFSSFYPAGGIIETYLGDTIHLQLETKPGTTRSISPDMQVDSSFFDHSPGWVFLQPEEKEHSLSGTDLARYRFAVMSPAIEWIYLLYNNDVVLKYKVRVKLKRS